MSNAGLEQFAEVGGDVPAGDSGCRIEKGE